MIDSKPDYMLVRLSHNYYILSLRITPEADSHTPAGVSLDNQTTLFSTDVSRIEQNDRADLNCDLLPFSQPVWLHYGPVLALT